ncbi:MAG: redoxin domain-containing protein [Burkholderiaceae bacterium]
MAIKHTGLTQAIWKKRRHLLWSAAAISGSAYWLKTHKMAQAAPTARANPTTRTNPYGITGQMAPELKLDYWIDPKGKPTEFSVLANRGKWVFLKCFQDWCPGCHSSGFPTLQQFAAEFADHPMVAIAGIQTVFEGYRHNTIEDVRKLQLKYKLPIVMGHDPGDGSQHSRPLTMRKYRTGGTPWLILIAPDGQVIFNDFHVHTTNLIEYVRKEIG